IRNRRSEIGNACGAVSSVGSEHLAYTEGVGGSSPSPPTVGFDNALFAITLRQGGHNDRPPEDRGLHPRTAYPATRGSYVPLNRASTFGSRSNRENVPASAISLAASRNPAHAVRASVPPALIRRTPRAAASATVTNGALISRFTGLGATAATIAAMCSLESIRGAYRQSAPASA